MLRYFGNQSWINLEFIDASERLLEAFIGKTKMSEKRSGGFIPVYEAIIGEIAERVSEGGKYQVRIAQGTLFTDISESGGGYASGARKAKIKRHHNTNNRFVSPRTGELFVEVTPLSDQVKDTGRDLGRRMGMSEELLIRHPFPGPGRSLRIDGEVTKEALIVEGKADEIWVEHLRRHDLYASVWQAGASLLLPGVRTDTASELAQSIYIDELSKAGLDATALGASATLLQAEHTTTKGDDAGSGPIIVLSIDARKSCGALPWEVLDGLQKRISNEVSGIGAVCYQVSNTNTANLARKRIAMLWSVWSVTGFTARHAELPWEFLDQTQERIVREISEVGAVLYRISNKPITTIEIG